MSSVQRAHTGHRAQGTGHSPHGTPRIWICAYSIFKQENLDLHTSSARLAKEMWDVDLLASWLGWGGVNFVVCLFVGLGWPSCNVSMLVSGSMQSLGFQAQGNSSCSHWSVCLVCLFVCLFVCGSVGLISEVQRFTIVEFPLRVSFFLFGLV
jgi:hypothetical protein